MCYSQYIKIPFDCEMCIRDRYGNFQRLAGKQDTKAPEQDLTGQYQQCQDKNRDGIFPHHGRIDVYKRQVYGYLLFSIYRCVEVSIH